MSTLNQHSTEEIPLLDDGRYFAVAVLSTEHEDDDAPVFMHAHERRGDSCVGTCLPQADGVWEARITVLYDDESNSDSLLVGCFDQRIDAIVHMWFRRFETMSINP
jgi:hypothetical protein